MDTKEYLSQIERLDTLIDQKISEKEALMRLDGVSGICYDFERVNTSPAYDAPFVRIAEKIEQCEEEITELIDRFVDIKAEIIKQIQAVPKLEYMQLLYKRYVEYKSLDKIAHEMHYSYDWVSHTHRKALRAFSAVWNEGKQIHINLYSPRDAV